MTTTLLLTGTHLVCVVLGAVLARWLTLRTIRTWPDHPHPLEALEARMSPHREDETTRDRDRREVRNGVRTSVALLLAGIFVMVIGLQALAYQQDQNADEERARAADRARAAQVECINQWGQAFYEATTTRVTSNGKLERAENKLRRAESRRDRAIDTILLTVIAFRAIPPKATDADFTEALAEYQRALGVRDDAKDARDDVQAEVEQLRADTPYPALTCGVELDKDNPPKE